MNLLLVKPEELQANNQAILLGERARYVYEFHNLKVDLKLTAGLLNGKIGQAEVKKISRDEVVLKVDFNRDPIPLHQFHLILAIPRPQIIKKVLSVVCELGIAEVTLVCCERTVKSYLSAQVLKKDKLEYFLVKGLEQSANTLIPTIAIEQSLPMTVLKNSNNSDLKFVAHSEQSQILRSFFSESQHVRQPSEGSKVIMAIGPEAGWSSSELKFFKENNYTNINLGTRILRVDTAISYLFAQLQIFID